METPADVSADLGKLTEEEVIFPHPWDAPAALLLALAEKIPTWGLVLVELCESELGKHWAAARSDAFLSIHRTTES